MRNWSSEAVFYHIYPLGFCGAPEWNDNHSEPVERLNKVNEWIPHMKSLGVTALYLGPVFESIKHGYDTTDYFRVDRRLGTNETLKRLSQNLHNNGINLVLDGVFNHVGREHFAFRDMKNYRENSNYRFWFHNVNFHGNNGYNDGFYYEGWSGCYDLVKLNLKNDDAVNHLLAAAKFWIDEFNIDGIRLDAADSIEFEFFKKLKHFTKSIKSDFWLMGEVVHGDYARWANPEMLDATTNYEAYKGLYSSINDKNMFEIGYSLKRQFGEGGMYKGLKLYNFADNHDVNRVASNLRNTNKLYSLYALMFTMPGIPSIYYGSEFGLAGRKNGGYDGELRPYIELHEARSRGVQPELEGAIKRFVECRKNVDSLKYGDYKELMVQSEQLVFMRKTDNEKCIVAVNIGDVAKEVELAVDGDINEMEDVLNGYEKIWKGGNGKLKMVIPANWGRVLVRK